MNKKNRNLFLVFAMLSLVLMTIGGCDSATSNNKNAGNSPSKSGSSQADVYNRASPGAVPPNYLGAPNAAVTLEEFADFQCPTCASIHPRVQELRAAYGDRLRIIFREFPLKIPQHDKAYEAAVAAEAAGMQGKFWDMQNLLFTNQQSWSISQTYRQTFQDYAQKLGLDVQKFSDDMAGLLTKNRVDADMQRGNSLGINSTPSIFINGRSVQDMTVEGMKKMIDEELQKAPANRPAAPSAPAAANTSSNQSNASSANKNSNQNNTEKK